MADTEPSIGAIWRKSGPKGEYFTGTLELAGKDGEKIRIVAFAHQKANDKQPDFKIYRSKPRESRDDGDPGF